jgi:KDO2-lipid IV(A) lauroyltransferase
MDRREPQSVPIIARVGIALIEGAFRLVGRLSLVSIDRIARRLGPVLHRLDGKHRRIVKANLERAFGGQKTGPERRIIEVRVFENLVRILLEIGWSMNREPEDLRKFLRLRGLFHFTAAHRQGRGVLFLTAHAGNWELLPVLGSLYRFPVNVLYRPLDSPAFDRLVRKMRSRFGAKMIPTHRAARKVLGCLRKGEIVAILMDQNVDWYEGVFVDFFGSRACTNKGMALIALKTGAPVLPIFLVREQGGFAVEVGAPIPLIRTGDKTRDIEANTQLYNDAIERFVRRYPDQWFWVHQRWKTRPYQPWPREPAR